MNTPCPCSPHKTFAQCCGRFLADGQHAKTPEQLMRSRYSAYALGGYGRYLLQTWFPATAQGLTIAALSERSVDWCKLEVLAKSQQGDDGEVEFKAYFTTGAATADVQVMHEYSTFKRNSGHWYYVGGRVSGVQ